MQTITARPLTAKQQGYLADLLAKVNDPEVRANVRHMLNDLYVQRLLTPAEASRQITGLRTVIATQGAYTEVVNTHGVPAGRYAVENEAGDLAFYRLRTDGVLVVRASDAEHEIPGARATSAILAKIAAAGIEEAGFRFGREIGQCCRCGRSLTSDWRQRGIGPTCVTK